MSPETRERLEALEMKMASAMRELEELTEHLRRQNTARSTRRPPPLSASPAEKEPPAVPQLAFSVNRELLYKESP